MNLIGKVFTGLVAVLSIVFLVVAVSVSATHIDHRKKIADATASITRMQTSIDELKKQLDQKKTELAQEQIARRMALAALQFQLNNDREKLSEKETEVNRLTAMNTTQTQTLDESVKEIRRLSEENLSIKTQTNKIITDRDQQRRRVITLTDALNGLQSVRADLESLVKKLQDDATLYQARWETAQSALKMVGITDPEDVPPAELKGEILKVNSDQLVEISLGRDDGLREGHTLEVYRGAQYLGRIRIRTVKDDRSTGKVLSNFRKGYIQEGDKVAARIGN